MGCPCHRLNSSQCPFYPTTSFLYFPQHLLGYACLAMWAHHWDRLRASCSLMEGRQWRNICFPKEKGYRARHVMQGVSDFSWQRHGYLGSDTWALVTISWYVTGLVALGTEPLWSLLDKLINGFSIPWSIWLLIGRDHTGKGLWPANSLSLGE